MRLFVGLGNPGSKYANNRHNIGFMAVDEIARRHGFAPWRRRFQGETSEGTLDREKVVLLRPTTYMNKSGRAVQEAANFFKLSAGEITVFQDELELPAAKVRVKIGGGIAGHNGLRSISSHIGNDYRRVRLGIGHPGVKELVHSHVLSDFAKSDRPWVEALCEAVADNAGLLATGKDSTFQNKVHLTLQAKGFFDTGGWRAIALISSSPDLIPRMTTSINSRAAGSRERSEAEMGFKCGIVGLPNVGKSTLFNALTETAAAQAANYPFCTIEPNVGEVAVPDPRLDKLSAIAGSAQIIPTRLTFVDIAGLVRGASKGEGLGNQFLATIREVDAVAHVVRCFEDSDITHVEGKIEPLADIETIETELMLADLDSLEKRVDNLAKKAKGNDKDAKEALDLVNRALVLLRDGKPARFLERKPEEERAFGMLGLLTSKPVLYVCNVEEGSAKDGNGFSKQVFEHAKKEGAVAVVISAKIEAEIATLSREERAEFLETLGLEEAGLDRLIRAGYELLDLITYFTAGPKEARAWTIHRGTKAPAAAGVIHTDFEKGFIRAETIAYDDYVALNGEAGARDAGKLRLEGKEYVVADGDVMHFRFNT